MKYNDDHHWIDDGDRIFAWAWDLALDGHKPYVSLYAPDTMQCGSVIFDTIEEAITQMREAFGV